MVETCFVFRRHTELTTMLMFSLLSPCCCCPSCGSCSPCRVGLAAGSRVPTSLVPTSRSSSCLLVRAPSALLSRGETPLGHSSSAACPMPHKKGYLVGQTAMRLLLRDNRCLTQRTARLGETAATSEESTEGREPPTLRGRSQAARVTVRRANERDYKGVAGIREVIVPVGMSGATGFMGGKVVIDSPAEAEKRLLMAKVWMCTFMCYGFVPSNEVTTLRRM